MVGAAFYDLDRTLLAGGSGPVVSAALRDVGLGAPDIGVDKVLFKVFDTFGENRPSMMLAREGARFSKGWPRERVLEAGHLACDELLARVQPFVADELQQHRDAGRKIVLATTTPRDLLIPFAKAMGFDELLATRYAEGDDGLYTGKFDGPFVWNRGKLAAVRAWSDENEIDLADCYAYSDSYYDIPMLSAVGNPVAVNPDLRLRVVARAKSWPVRFLDAPKGVSRLGGVELQQAMIPFLRKELVAYADIEVDGLENLPESGPVILVSNHRSYFDPMALAFALAPSGRPVRFLAKKELFEVPVARHVLEALGTVRVDRGTGSSKPLDSAAAALAGGEQVLILPEGTIPRGEAFFDPKLEGRPGAARLAARTDTPVIPIGVWGTEKVWPRNSKFPIVWNVFDRPKVKVSIGAPVKLKHKSENADTKRIMAAISAQLPPEAAERHEPTEEELAATYPGGKAPSGD